MDTDTERNGTNDRAGWGEEEEAKYSDTKTKKQNINTNERHTKQKKKAENAKQQRAGRRKDRQREKRKKASDGANVRAVGVPGRGEADDRPFPHSHAIGRTPIECCVYVLYAQILRESSQEPVQMARPDLLMPRHDTRFS